MYPQQHVPAARENIHTHKLLQYLLHLHTTYTITAILIITVD